jgi:shikimate dehydrogenase
VAGVIGDPVRHSRSPAIHNAAFAAAGLDWVFVAFPVAAGRGADAVRAMSALGIDGLSVTMPHKSDAAAACDVVSDDARALGAVNAIGRDERGTWGDSTDGEGCRRALADAAIDPSGRSVLVLGAGGAARAIALALGRTGAEVTVAARSRDAAEAAAALATRGRGVGLERLDVGAADVIVNATPLGMRGEPPPFDPGRLRPEQFVLDTVYHPAETPLLAAAHAAGVPAANGVGMLVHQAAIAFEAWTGVAAPLEAMREAAGS